MSIITRARNSTKRIAFKWSVVSNCTSSALDLSGMTLQMIIDSEEQESTPDTPLHIAVINGIITDTANGQAYFPLTVAVTGTVQKLFFEVWATDINGETYPIDSGSLIITGSLK